MFCQSQKPELKHLSEWKDWKELLSRKHWISSSLSYSVNYFVFVPFGVTSQITHIKGIRRWVLINTYDRHLD